MLIAATIVARRLSRNRKIDDDREDGAQAALAEQAVAQFLDEDRQVLDGADRHARPRGGRRSRPAWPGQRRPPRPCSRSRSWNRQGQRRLAVGPPVAGRGDRVELDRAEVADRDRRRRAAGGVAGVESRRRAPRPRFGRGQPRRSSTPACATIGGELAGRAGSGCWRRGRRRSAGSRRRWRRAWRGRASPPGASRDRPSGRLARRPRSRRSPGTISVRAMVADLLEPVGLVAAIDEMTTGEALMLSAWTSASRSRAGPPWPARPGSPRSSLARRSRTRTGSPPGRSSWTRSTGSTRAGGSRRWRARSGGSTCSRTSDEPGTRVRRDDGHDRELDVRQELLLEAAPGRDTGDEEGRREQERHAPLADGHAAEATHDWLPRVSVVVVTVDRWRGPGCRSSGRRRRAPRRRAWPSSSRS